MQDWDTNDEIKYLRKIGNHREVGFPKTNAKTLIYLYIKASKNRNWGSIDGKYIINLANELLA
jgi:hypothetical protein